MPHLVLLRLLRVLLAAVLAAGALVATQSTATAADPDHALSGTVSLAGGGSVPDARTSVRVQRSVSQGWLDVKGAWADEAGAFSFTLPAGTYRVVLVANRHGEMVVGPFDLTADRVLPHVELQRLPVVTGTVVLSDGLSPLDAGAFVRAWGPGDRVADSADPGADGSFVLDLAPGTYELEVSAEGYMRARIPLTVQGSQEIPPIRLTRLVRLSGRVVAPDAACCTVGVDVLDVAGGPVARGHVVDDSGTYWVDVVPGRYRLVHRAGGYASRTVEVEVVAGADVALAPVRLVPDADALRNVQRPSFAGDAVVGRRLTASAGTWSHPGATLSYQWLADGRPVVGATAADFVPTTAHAGHAITLEVTAVLPDADPVVARAARAALVVHGPARLRGTPRLVGALRVGSTVRVGGAAPAQPGTSTRYEWFVDGRVVRGATGAALLLRPEHVGRRISARAHLSAHAYSPAVEPVAAPATRVAAGVLTVRSAPRVEGTPRVGSRLVAVPGTYAPSSVKVRYQWFAGGRRIAGATKRTFRPVTAQRGRRLAVRVTVSAPGYRTRAVTTRPTRIVR